MTSPIMLRRRIARVADQRLEPRFQPPAEAVLGFRANRRHAVVRDISRSGVRIEGELAAAGQSIEIAFAGFPPIIGVVAWAERGRTGVQLPTDSMDLLEA